MSNRYLTLYERQVIEDGLNERMELKQIAELIKKHEDTVQKEIARNGGIRFYTAIEGQKNYEIRHSMGIEKRKKYQKVRKKNDKKDN